MKPSYSNINLTTGHYAGGIYKIKIAPKEWLAFPITPNFSSGKVIDEVLLQDGKEFIELECAPDTYEFDEKPKSNRGGSYFEITIQGTVNNVTPELLATLETLRYHEVVAILYDKRRRLKVVGNEYAGLVFRYSNKEDSTKQGGLQICAIDLTMDSDKASPFYVI